MTLCADIVNMTYPPRQGTPPWRLWSNKSSDPNPARTLIGNLALELKVGELVSIIGPSGAGKTTLLRILAGLELHFEGRVSLNGTQVAGPTRKVQIVFQEHRLFPWLNATRNVLFAADHQNAVVTEDDVETLLRSIDLGKLVKAYPKRMSGGEQTRVALARALISTPQVLLLDEPFRALDQVTKEALQDELLEWFDGRRDRMAILLVSHSISDAVFLSDRVVVMKRDPLTEHRMFVMPTHRRRRAPDLIQEEERILVSLREAATGTRRDEGTTAPQSSSISTTVQSR